MVGFRLVMNGFGDTSGMFWANSDRGLGDWRRRKEGKKERRKEGKKERKEERKEEGKERRKEERKREKKEGWMERRKDGWEEIFSVGMEGSPDVFRIFAMIWHMMD